MQFYRTLDVPKSHFFLFGPRGTGKSTWLKNQFKPALTINLLLSREFLAHSGDLTLLRQKTEALPVGSRIVIDEIQKLPSLLDEVHALIFDYEDRYQFALSGSSARKIKQNQGNMLAGRALTRSMFGLTAAEMNFDFNPEEMIKFGTLPKIHTLSGAEDKVDYLHSYVDTYLKEEIQQESAVRNLNSYHRYLKYAALLHGQSLNMSSLSRDAAVARSTVDGYFSIVEETLLGFFLPAIQLKAKVKEVVNSKFYFFDCGVVRALQNAYETPSIDPDPFRKGFLLEGYVINEVRAYWSYHQIRGEMGFWGTPGKNEVDLICQRGKKTTGIEIKSSKKWKSEFSRGLKALLGSKKINQAFGVYLGNDLLKDDEITVYPLMKFLEKLHSGEIL